MMLTMTPLDLGDQFDQYRLEEHVACSGMASIFRATDTRAPEHKSPSKSRIPKRSAMSSSTTDSSGKLRLANSSITRA